MIPAIGTMLAAYIVFRCLEALCFHESRYRSPDARFAAGVFAVLAGLLTLAAWFALLMSATSPLK